MPDGFTVNPKNTNYISFDDSEKHLFQLPNILINEIPISADEKKIAAAVRKYGIGINANAKISRTVNSITMNISFIGNKMKIKIEATKSEDLVYINIIKNKENPIVFTGKLAVSEDNKKIIITDIKSDSNPIKIITMKVNGRSEIEITNNFLESDKILVLKPHENLKD